MQDMSDWEILGDQLRKRQIDLDAATFLGELLGSMNVKTSRGALTTDGWQEMMARFRYFFYLYLIKIQIFYPSFSPNSILVCEILLIAYL